MRADQARDPRPEQRLDERGAAPVVIGVVVGVDDVGDVVHESGDRELGIIGMLGAKDRRRTAVRGRDRRASVRPARSEPRARSSIRSETEPSGCTRTSSRLGRHRAERFSGGSGAGNRYAGAMAENDAEPTA